jgi:hypothetical protein
MKTKITKNPFKIVKAEITGTSRATNAQVQYMVDTMKKLPIGKPKAVLIPKSVYADKKRAVSFAGYCASIIRKNERSMKDYSYTTRTVLNDAKEYVGVNVFRTH